MIAVETSGPLFTGTLDVKRGMRLGLERATTRAAEIAREHLRARSRYSTPKYGHAAESVRSVIRATRGDESEGAAFIGGQAAYLGPWLEFGVKPHDMPKAGRRVKARIRTVRAGGGIRRSIDKYTLLAYKTGGVTPFRTYSVAKPFKHRGMRAYRWRSLSQAQINQEAPAIFEQALGEALR